MEGEIVPQISLVEQRKPMSYYPGQSCFYLAASCACWACPQGVQAQGPAASIDRRPAAVATAATAFGQHHTRPLPVKKPLTALPIPAPLTLTGIRQQPWPSARTSVASASWPR